MHNTELTWKYVWCCLWAQIGDTPDDVRAAVAAGSVPIGVLTPDEEAKGIIGGSANGNSGGDMLGPSLLSAGAAVVLRPGLAELLDYLPPVGMANGVDAKKRKVRTTHMSLTRLHLRPLSCISQAVGRAYQSTRVLSSRPSRSCLWTRVPLKIRSPLLQLDAHASRL
jgi:hypothetical protein